MVCVFNNGLLCLVKLSSVVLFTCSNLLLLLNSIKYAPMYNKALAGNYKLCRASLSPYLRSVRKRQHARICHPDIFEHSVQAQE